MAGNARDDEDLVPTLPAGAGMGRRMMEAERHARLLELIAERGRVSIHDILEALPTSEATLRRDLAKLDSAGRLRRVRGGAEALSGTLTTVHPYGEAPHLDAKRRIAARAAALCGPGEAVIIDGGSTTYHIPPHLPGGDKTIYTNSFPIAEYLVHHTGHRLILPPGEVERSTMVIQDPFGRDQLGNYAWRWAFMGCGGLDGRGITNSDTLLIRDEQRMLAIAERVVIVADSGKFQRQGQLRLCGWDQVHILITDPGIPAEFRTMLADQGVEVVIA